MIDDASKIGLIKELEKVGNILVACQKSNISRATFYRWRDSDSKFKRDVMRALRLGRESSIDMVEYSLLKGAKEGKIENIKYYLSHNSPKYKPKKSDKFIIEHRSGSKTSLVTEKTIEELLAQGMQSTLPTTSPDPPVSDP